MAQKHISAKTNKKKKHQAGSLQAFITVIRCLFWPFGMATFRLPKKYGNDKTLSVINEKWMIDTSFNAINAIITLILSGVITIAYYYLADFELSDPKITKLTTGMILLVVINSWRMLSGIVTAWSFTIRRDLLASAFNKLWFIDMNMRSIGKYPSYIYYSGFVLFAYFAALSTRIALAILEFLNGEREVKVLLMAFFSDGIQFMIHFLVLLLFNVYVMIMYARFGFVNDCVESLRGDSMSMDALEEKSKTQDKKMTLEKSSRTLGVVCSIYESLCYGGEDMNAVCTIPLFTIVIINFTEGILLAYLYLFEKSSIDHWRLIWNFCSFVFMLITLLTTGMVKGQIQAVARHLAESDICYVDKSMNNARNIFLLQTLQHSLDFTACGCFPITVSDMFGQVGVCISLLLFLFQLASQD